MSPSLKTRYEWRTLPWRRIQGKVFKLQRRIYRASRRRQVKLVHKLQRLLAKSWYARLLAVRRVTQDNKGKRTAGIDGIKKLTPPQRLEMAQSLTTFSKPRPLRRIWIPKPGKTEKRPLSIPTMRDRATQALIKLALEPQWEAKLDPNMYGFRLGRSCQDAIEAVYRTIFRQPKFVLSVDIRGCFDNISHDAILKKSRAPTWMKRLIKGWLKCGVLDNGFHRTERGSPQGGVISPLLALIALQGLERHIKRLGTQTYPLYVVAYADDIVILARREKDIHRAQATLAKWLHAIGLELNPQKTTISHTLQGESPGFEFLGFQVRQHPAGQYQARRGYKTRITPGAKNVKRHLEYLKVILQAHQGMPQQALIGKLNPIIQGWCQYYRGVNSYQTFDKLSSILFHQLLSWAKRRHANLNVHQIVSRYWSVNADGKWAFQSKDGPRLRFHRQTRFQVHIKVRTDRSPYDGDWTYWGSRLRRYPGVTPLKSSLLRSQEGKCRLCGLNFLPGALIEVHHLDGNHDNHRRHNLALLHRHCHDQAHSADTSAATGPYDKSPVREEPYEVESLTYGSEAESGRRLPGLG
ncbi:MAG: group II intron reverse transcriptase/maturase [Cyanobacteria bacterium J06626_18]